MNQAMEWIKATVFIVVFALLMVAGLVALPYFSSGMNVGVKDLVDKRGKMRSQIQSLEKTEVAPPRADRPVEGEPALVNENLLAAYTAHGDEMRTDADAVFGAAVEFNRKNHSIFMDGVFPSMPPQQAEVLPVRFHGVMLSMYDGLLNTVNVGVPPTTAELADELQRTELNFITQSLQKEGRDDLDEDELEELTKKLVEVRLAKNREQAEDEGISFYLDRHTALVIEGWDQSQIPTEGYMFVWNWEYWVVHDVLMALHNANAAQQTVLLAPVKRVLSLHVNGLPGIQRSSGSAAAAPRVGGGKSAGSQGGGATRSSGGSSASPGGGTPALPDPKKPVAAQYAGDFTGRISNALYDVLHVNLDIVVDSTRIPEVIDALAQENFFTVSSLELEPVDSFAAAAEGYMYGSDPVCRLRLTLETVWLREWTSEYMPDSVRAALAPPLPPLNPPASNDS
jgi:hypothetical protein